MTGPLCISSPVHTMPMGHTMSEALDLPAGIDLPGRLPKPSKRKLVACVVAPVGVMALLSVIDVQTMGQQKPATCEATQQAVTVPKPHIWLAGTITGVMDEPTALRDVMARTHPEVALTEVIAANPTVTLSPMGDVPPTYGGVACLDLPQVAASTAPAVKVAPQGKAGGQQQP